MLKQLMSIFKQYLQNPKPFDVQNHPHQSKTTIMVKQRKPNSFCRRKKKRREKPKGIGSSLYKESFQPKIKKQNQRRNT